MLRLLCEQGPQPIDFSEASNRDKQLVKIIRSRHLCIDGNAEFNNGMNNKQIRNIMVARFQRTLTGCNDKRKAIIVGDGPPKSEFAERIA